MTEDGVTFSRSGKVYVHMAQSMVSWQDGDRVSAPDSRDGCQHLFAIKIILEDLDVMREFTANVQQMFLVDVCCKRERIAMESPFSFVYRRV